MSRSKGGIPVPLPPIAQGGRVDGLCPPILAEGDDRGEDCVGEVVVVEYGIGPVGFRASMREGRSDRGVMRPSLGVGRVITVVELPGEDGQTWRGGEAW